jgi:uncharacterized membrane protein
MNFVRILTATVAGTIAFVLLGGLTFGVLLASFMKENMIQYPGMVKEPPDWIPLILFNFIFAWLFAFIFDYWAKIRTFVGGLKGGALIMLPIVVGTDFQYLAFMNVFKNWTPLVVDAIAATILGALVGGIIGLVLGMMNKAPKME